MAKNKEIKRPHLILCEGADATLFMIYYLNYLIENNESEFDNFQAVDFEGNENLPRFLQLLKLSTNYNTIKSITIIRDAEKDHIAAKQSVSSALKNHGFSAPSQTNEIVQDDTRKIAFVLFPTLSETTEDGTLEDLYVKNLVESPDELIKDIDVFINGLKEKGHNIPRPHKSRLYTYFAVTDKFTSLKLAEAAQAGAFDFDCSEMNGLKKLLKKICSI